MSRKKKRGGISSEAKTCFYLAIGFLVVGIACIIYGKLFYHSEDMVTIDDIVTGQTATIVSVDKVERNLSSNEKKRLRDNGYTDDEIRWGFDVVYSVEANGREYTYEDTVAYHEDDWRNPHVGDTDVINYAVKDGKFIPHPETQGTNGSVIIGWILAILSIPAAGIGLFLRK